ncbi:tRNA (adenosine(37)-N6)-threonylcarbamoyltransferase complex ATPase subunit type 1 TsaE [Patescibacteria group bacterium]|nr:tRNA (adenosine(37)-N6)-threonylcarbamoyltransferase complex ATPase subunit type 1 TsaE [Patescibacteria group bacterium]
MENITKSTGETKKLAFEIAKRIKNGDVIALYGDLGGGKTTFTRYLVEGLGLENRVQSPTFVVARKYGYVNHVDLYRLTSKEEAKDIGIEEMISDEESITVIEWPEIIEDLFPRKAVKIYFEYIDENTRKITIKNLH